MPRPQNVARVHVHVRAAQGRQNARTGALRRSKSKSSTVEAGWRGKAETVSAHLHAESAARAVRTNRSGADCGRTELQTVPKGPGDSRVPGAKGIQAIVASENRLIREALMRALKGRNGIKGCAIQSVAANDLNAVAFNGYEILVLCSSGIVAEDLRNIWQLRSRAPDVRILLLGLSDHESDFLQCVRAGVRGYLPQQASGQEVLEGIKAIAAGEAVCSGQLLSVLFRNFEKESCSFPSSAAQRPRLSRREKQLVPLIGQGLANKEIAAQLAISEQTVKNHLNRLKHKVGAEERMDIAEVCRLQLLLD